MKNRIPEKDYINIAPEGKDEYITVNHTQCSAGEDKRKRLWIKNDGKYIVAYCHNCGLKGFTKIKRKAFFIPQKKVEKKEYDTGKLITVPMKHRWYLYQYGFDDYDIVGSFGGFGLAGWSESLNRIVFRHFYTDWLLFSYQCRAIYGETPKVISINKKDPWVLERFSLNKASDSLVIVEDFLSMIKVYWAGYRCAALLGTSLPVQYSTALTKYKNIVLWLDPDPAGIKGAKKLKKYFEQFNCNVRIIHSDKDPKYYSYEEIKDILT